MRHLFIINPAAKKIKGRADIVKDEIDGFFKNYPKIHYDIYISAWCRDAVSYIRGYIMQARMSSDEIIRVHAVGGSGTLFEVVNGVIGFDNTEIAAYPYGMANVFLRYFGGDNLKLFSEIHNQVFERVIPVDVIRCGNNYGISYGIVGFEAACAASGDVLIERGISTDTSYILSALPKIISAKGICQSYKVEIDGKRLDGVYLSILIANTPCYGQRFYPAAGAHPDDGKLDFILIKRLTRIRQLTATSDYLKGGYRNYSSDELIHCTGKKITVSADETMCMNIDSETFYNNSAEFELLPGAVKLVCPERIDLGKLPLFYNNPKEGTRGGT